MNEATVQATGVPREKLIGTNFVDYFTEPAKAREGYQRVFSEGFVRDYPLSIRHISGRVIDVLYNASVYKDEQGAVRGVFAAARDITERKRAEVSLRESEQAFRTLAESVPQMVWATRPDGWNIYFNQQWVDYTGLTLAESYGHGWNVPFHPDDRERARDAWQQATQHGGTYSLEARLRRADGVYRWWLVRGVPLRDTTGKTIKWFGTCTDIHDLKLAQEALRASEGRFRTIFEEAPLGVALIDSLTGQIYEVNARFAAIAGRTKAEIVSLDWMSITHPDDVQEDLDNMARLNAGKISGFNMEKRYRRPDGSYVWINMTIAPVTVEDRSHPRHLCMIEDITERKRAEEDIRRLNADLERRVQERTQELRESQERFQVAARATNDVVWDWNLLTNEIWWNEAFKTVFGYRAEEVEPGAESWTGRIHPEDVARVEAGVHQAIENGATRWSDEYRFRRADDSFAFVLDRGEIMRDEQGKPMRMVGAMVDLTERKQKEDELRQLNRTLTALGKSSQALLRAAEEQAYLQEVCRIVVEDCAHAMVWIGFAEDDEDKTVRPVVYSGFEEGYLETLHVTWADTERGRGPTGTAIRTGQPCGCANMLTDPRFAPWRAEALRRGYASSFVLPLRAEGKTFGALTIYSRKPEAFSEAEVKLLSSLANDLAFGITSIRLRAAHARDEVVVQESEDRLRFALETIETGAWDLDLVNHTAFHSPEHDRIFGYAEPLPEWTYEMFLKHVLPEDRTMVDSQFQRAMETKGDWNFECRIRRTDGEVRWITAAGRHRPDAAGAPSRMAGVVQDITARKRAEEALVQQREELQVILDASPAVIFYKDRENHFLRVNRAFAESMGTTKEQLEGRSLFDLYPREQAEFFWKDDREVITTGRPKMDIIEPMQTPAGERWLLTDKVPCYDAQGNIVGVIGFAVDITERRQAEEALRRSREDLDRAQAVGQIGSWRMNVRCNVLTWSDENHRIFGVPKGTPLTYESFLEKVHPDDRPAVDAQWNAALRGVPYDLEHRIVVDGRVKWVREKADLERDEAGELLGAFGITQDITARKQAEEALRESEQALQRRATELAVVNKELEAFSYSVSHDLRAPLRSIDGFSQALLEDYGGKLDDEGQDFLRRVRAASQHMGRLIDDLLKLSRLTRDPMRYAEVDLSAMAQTIAAELRAAEPERTVIFEIAPDVRAVCDERLLRVVLDNLLGNAWKFTSRQPDARIEFGARQQDDGMVYFVRDNGVGFDMTYAEKLFGAFQRLHSTAEFPGTGIGLATVQRVIHRHGGRVWAESKPGKGATFHFTLPKQTPMT